MSDDLGPVNDRLSDLVPSSRPGAEEWVPGHEPKQSGNLSPSRIFQALGVIEDVVASGLLAFMVVVVVADVGSRYILSNPLRGAGELATAAFVWAVFIGSASAARRRSHIAVVLFDGVLAPRGIVILDTIAIAFALTLCILLSSLGIDEYQAMGGRTIPLTNVPFKYVAMAVPVGFVLMGIHYVASILENIRTLLRGGVGASAQLIDRRIDQGSL